MKKNKITECDFCLLFLYLFNFVKSLLAMPFLLAKNRTACIHRCVYICFDFMVYALREMSIRFYYMVVFMVHFIFAVAVCKKSFAASLAFMVLCQATEQPKIYDNFLFLLCMYVCAHIEEPKRRLKNKASPGERKRKANPTIAVCIVFIWLLWYDTGVQSQYQAKERFARHLGVAISKMSNEITITCNNQTCIKSRRGKTIAACASITITTSTFIFDFLTEIHWEVNNLFLLPIDAVVTFILSVSKIWFLFLLAPCGNLSFSPAGECRLQKFFDYVFFDIYTFCFILFLFFFVRFRVCRPKDSENKKNLRKSNEKKNKDKKTRESIGPSPLFNQSVGGESIFIEQKWFLFCLFFFYFTLDWHLFHSAEYWIYVFLYEITLHGTVYLSLCI